MDVELPTVEELLATPDLLWNGLPIDQVYQAGSYHERQACIKKLQDGAARTLAARAKKQTEFKQEY